MSFDQRSLIHREAWFPPCFVRQNQKKEEKKRRGDFRPFPNKNVQIWDHSFHYFSPKDSKSIKILDIQLREMGAKRPLKGTSKVNTQTDRQTNKHMDISTYRKHRPRGPRLWKGIIMRNGTPDMWHVTLSLSIVKELELVNSKQSGKHVFKRELSPFCFSSSFDILWLIFPCVSWVPLRQILDACSVNP